MVQPTSHSGLLGCSNRWVFRMTAGVQGSWIAAQHMLSYQTCYCSPSTKHVVHTTKFVACSLALPCSQPVAQPNLVVAKSTHKGVNQRSEYVTQVQQRPDLSMGTLTWHACKYKVHKLHQRYIFKLCWLWLVDSAWSLSQCRILHIYSLTCGRKEKLKREESLQWKVYMKMWDCYCKTIYCCNLWH